METANNKVLNELRRSTMGITHWNFPKGFALRSRIADLRSIGKEIVTKLERNDNNTGKHARYFLIK
jgi:hypothetical protein